MWNWVAEAEPEDSKGQEAQFQPQGTWRMGWGAPCEASPGFVIIPISAVFTETGPSPSHFSPGYEEHTSLTPIDAPICVTRWGTLSLCQACMDISPRSSVRAAPPCCALSLRPNESPR